MRISFSKNLISNISWAGQHEGHISIIVCPISITHKALASSFFINKGWNECMNPLLSHGSWSLSIIHRHELVKSSRGEDSLLPSRHFAYHNTDSGQKLQLNKTANEKGITQVHSIMISRHLRTVIPIFEETNVFMQARQRLTFGGCRLVRECT